jgi:hypothetical protein
MPYWLIDFKNILHWLAGSNLGYKIIGMYKAIYTVTGQEIIILSPVWLKQMEHLREMDRADVLVCQGCRQPLRVKAGEHKRPHFAHKHLQACSYGSETPEILSARAVLYQWLFRQFGEAVTVEKELAEAGLPRPIDCWVEREAGCFAYWIIEAGIKLETREGIKAAFSELDGHFHAIFLSAMLTEEKKEFQSLLLAPTERAFLQSSPFDEALAGIGEPGQSLHYLDPDAQTITTFRDLRLHHRPNWFKGLKKTTTLSGMRVSMLTGDPMHPGELDRLRRYQQKRQRLEKKQKQYQEQEAGWQERLEASKQAQPDQEVWKPDRSRLETEWKSPSELPCEKCGQITSDYWYSFSSKDGHRLCRCRECMQKDLNDQQ